MKILAIRFQNLNSLRETHEVVLESGPLAEAGLFAITGPTGAGKSTILDAVTLALYGRAARYGSNSAEDMMSRGAGECSATVEFECESGRYTARWLLRRSRGRADGKFQPVKHELSQDGVIIEDRTSGVVRRVEALTQLDYERFLRSVLLAQGQFAAFLHAPRDKRAELLERITGSHIYSELGSLAHNISAGHRGELEKESSRLSGIVLLAEEARVAIAERLSILAQEQRTADAGLATLRAQVTAGKRAVAVERQSQELAGALAAHQRSLDVFTPDAARLARHAITEPFAEALAALTNAAHARDERVAALTAARQSVSAAKAAAAQAGASALACIAAGESSALAEKMRITAEQDKNEIHRFAGEKRLAEHAADAGIATALPELSAHATRAGLLSSQHESAAAKLTTARAVLVATQEQLTVAHDLLTSARAASAQAHQSAEAAKTALDGLLAPPWSSPAAIDAEVTRLSTALATLNRLSSAHVSLADQEAGITALSSEIAGLQSGLNTLTEAERLAVSRLDAARREYSLLHELVLRDQRILSLSDHRAHLVAGEPCPLCGSPDHPWAAESAIPDANSSGERLKRQTAVVQDFEKAASAATAGLTSHRQSLNTAEAQRTARAESLSIARNNLFAEWKIVAPDTTCTAESLASLTIDLSSRSAAVQGLAQRVRAAHEAERAATAVAAKADAEAQLVQARLDAASQSALAAAGAIQEMETALTTANDIRTAHLLEATLAFAAFGESPGDSLPAALTRLGERDRTWRELSVTLAVLERESATLQYAHEKALTVVGTWNTRRQETTDALQKASLTPGPDAGSIPDWNQASSALNTSLAALHSTEHLALSVSAAADQATALVTQRQSALTDSLTGSAFPDIDSLHAARLDTATLQFLTRQSHSLREEEIRLHERRNAISLENQALQVSLTELHVSATADLPAWENALRSAEDQSAKLLTERGAVEQQLRSDDEARALYASAAAAHAERRSAAAPWFRLSELIGSVEGDKFSRFAQSITLDHLIALANARLARLCDRYCLLRSGTTSDLQIQIADAWQGDTVRPMESLSGGESFLVSLALALGLSELAGHRTRIGTLFIDEGFGTLDATALDTALSALESLRTGHSTIGIISHVETLKSRLTTRIEVSRNPGGWSTLAVRT